MNDLELFLLRKDFLRYHQVQNYHFTNGFMSYLKKNNLQNELTLKEAAYVVDRNLSSLLFYIDLSIMNIPESERYISENPEVADMKISDIVNYKYIKRLQNE